MTIVEKAEQHKAKRNNQPLMLGSLGSVLFLLVVIGSLLVILRLRRAKDHRTSGRPFSAPLFGGSSRNWLADRNANVLLASDLNLALKIPYAEIQRATKRFSSKLLIGEGGFGKVYQGTLGGKKVAVKRSEPGHGYFAPGNVLLPLHIHSQSLKHEILDFWPFFLHVID